MFRSLSRVKPPLSAPAKGLRARVNPGVRRITSSTKPPNTAPNPPAPIPKSNPGSSGHNLNPLEDPANDLGGPGGQEMYPASMGVHRRYASQTALGVMVSGAIMYIAKRLQWGVTDPNIVHVLVRDMSKGEIDDVKMIPVRVSAQR
ncbi:hypothetical protein B0T16DRAFT_332277 [Cercophora newfieldiana]|uniref:Uncharacterized protein n=1 Tax=Cercophora newfieldiana TaxID=92897 RepID=A0AA39Y278_9PEZI|nr:hypothetical protein B0T16DRAFT_332277 [Cercophora newfieldiana]